MPVIPLVPSDSPTLISSLLCLSAHHLALAALASQPLKSGTLSLYLSVPVPVLTPSVVISRPSTASRPSDPLNPSPLAPQIRLCWPLCAFINYIYLITYCQPPPGVHLCTWLTSLAGCLPRNRRSALTLTIIVLTTFTFTYLTSLIPPNSVMWQCVYSF